MKVLITEDTLDSLLSIKISSDGGKTYTDYSVSSLKDGLAFDCSPKNLKVICDANTLKYIQVLADGEKASSSDIDLSNYIKIKDIYVDVYKNPYYGKDLPKEEADKLQGLESTLYENKQYQYYCSGNEFTPDYWSYQLKLVESSDSNLDWNDKYYDVQYAFDKRGSVFMINDSYLSKENLEKLDVCYLITGDYNNYFSPEYGIFTNVRVHFIKHF